MVLGDSKLPHVGVPRLETKGRSGMSPVAAVLYTGYCNQPGWRSHPPCVAFGKDTGAGGALWTGELMLCITPSGGGVVPHQAWSATRAPWLAKKVLMVCGYEPGRRGAGKPFRASRSVLHFWAFPWSFR